MPFNLDMLLIIIKMGLSAAQQTAFLQLILCPKIDNRRKSGLVFTTYTVQKRATFRVYNWKGLLCKWKTNKHVTDFSTFLVSTHIGIGTSGWHFEHIFFVKEVYKYVLALQIYLTIKNILIRPSQFHKKENAHCSDKHFRQRHSLKLFSWRFVCFNRHLQKWCNMSKAGSSRVPNTEKELNAFILSRCLEPVSGGSRGGVQGARPPPLFWPKKIK